MKVRRCKADTGERAENVFSAFASNDAPISRQEQNRRVITCGKNECRRAKRGDTFETYRTRPFESDDRASANTLPARASCERELGRQRTNAGARRGGIAVNLIEIRKRSAWVGRKRKKPWSASCREYARDNQSAERKGRSPALDQTHLRVRALQPGV